MSNFEFAVPTLFGLEGIAGDELRRLNIENVRVENGRVLFSGDETALARANLNLRTAERVLLVLADFKATTFEELFQGVYHANLEDYIPKNGAFPVKGHCLSSQLMSVPDCQAIVKKAASKRLGEKYGIGWLPETGAMHQLQFSLMHDQFELFLDTTGAGDYFAAGFLYGLTCGYSLEKCAKIGSILSGNVIQVIGTTISPERWDEIKLNINKVLAE